VEIFFGEIRCFTSAVFFGFLVKLIEDFVDY